MINKIKQLADEALALQNKNRMDEVLREISNMCGDDKTKLPEYGASYKVPKEIAEEMLSYKSKSYSSKTSDELIESGVLPKGGKK